MWSIIHYFETKVSIIKDGMPGEELLRCEDKVGQTN